jgi:hypothetical protein
VDDRHRYVFVSLVTQRANLTRSGGFHGGNPQHADFRELCTRWFQYGKLQAKSSSANRLNMVQAVFVLFSASTAIANPSSLNMARLEAQHVSPAHLMKYGATAKSATRS